MPVLLVCLFACEPFRFSPTGLEWKHPKTLYNLANLDSLALDSGGTPRHFKIAVMADSHLWYDELKVAVERINADTSIDLVILAGDFTKFGYADEYDRFTDIFNKLKPPHLVGIGNHDLQADGVTVYRNVFGPTDFSFAYRGVKFIFFDDNARGIKCCVPKFDSLEKELAGAGDSLRIIAVSHAPPLSDQLDTAASERMAGLFAKYKVALSIHGHTHAYAYGADYGGGVPYLVADALNKRNYVAVVLADSSLTVERVYF
ncbi:MAG: hypothetical protein JWP91_1389 [Fibrobacteres bacterium]|nr:hypothetical protein [Fibrobacterota bacterium]